MWPALLLLLLGAALVRDAHAQADDQADYCLAKDQFPYLYFGSKTAYERVYDHKESPQNVPWCRPSTVWMMASAGTSYPDRATLVRLYETLPPLQDNILQNAVQDDGGQAGQRASRTRGRGSPWPRRRGRLCAEDLAALARWHLNVTEDRAHWLTGQGQADLSFLARRLKRRLPELLNTTYSESRFRFRYASGQRTHESAEAFASGLFSNEVELPRPVENDPLLEFDELCPAWRKDRERALKEVEIFEIGAEMEQTIARVSYRLGFHYNLSMENVDLMWEMCRYDKAWKYVSLSPWCSAFTEDDLKVMEYRADLQYYYSYSYGNQLNVKLGCPPVKDMMDHFTRAEMSGGAAFESIPPPTGVFYFTHDSALHMMLAALGVAKDPVPLMASNMEQQAKRAFRTSFIGSFAANLAAVFYTCDQGERHRVMFYLRERIVEMEGCQVGLCSWNHLRTKLAKAANGCDLNFCHTSGSAPFSASSVLAAAAAAALLAARRLAA
ncbi:multiple inositol polyphosphate phosphatase 1-like isoform X1 [Frankliniella occidentalis]|uniref:Multiple inositol polyphosphate phosphatase 1 n=1 Tax=Frankliniella occidentalis TaxID=133901 RepID=A0A9C6TTZ0_FRAOC|nr:multiple inositol polyphosphate phosphatase 1-like isoform X1 [Frankliniella occidentalis]XP_052120130.1 multiple inositol polyphosphate phosphatase 1-like isoform X1 [Frankliniella occidentalis]